MTVWEFVRGGHISRFKESVDPVQVSQEGETFIHRGPEGRRRGGAKKVGEVVAGSPALPSLVPVLEYRAHQVMRVL